jgi:hypothetical protein
MQAKPATFWRIQQTVYHCVRGKGGWIDFNIIWCKRSTIKCEFRCVVKAAWNVAREDCSAGVCSHPHSLKPQHLQNDRNRANFLNKKDLKNLDDAQYPSNSHNEVCSGKFNHTSPQSLPHQCKSLAIPIHKLSHISWKFSHSSPQI